jgi:predicted ArsR family transcriptional regulator
VSRRQLTTRDEVPISTQLKVAQLLKFHPGRSIGEVAKHLSISFEGARQLIEKMREESLIDAGAAPTSTRGRPAQIFTLTSRGEHLFPKHYAELSDSLISVMGSDELNINSVLSQIADAKTAKLMGEEELTTFEERLDALKGVYGEGDDYLSIERTESATRVIEHNCPYLTVALSHPALCSVTTNVMSRILERKVVRTQTFQNGDGRCVFEVLNQAAPEGFALETEADENRHFVLPGAAPDKAIGRYDH